MNEEYTIFIALSFAPGTHQVKVFYGMGIGTKTIGQTSPITNKLFTMYVGGGPVIVTSQTLVLDTTARYKVLVNNLTPEYFQKLLTNGRVVD